MSARAITHRIRHLRCLPVFVASLGALLFLGGAAMRVYARLIMTETEQRLTADQPAGPASRTVQPASFRPADGPPTQIRLPALGLWNALSAVASDVSWHDGQLDLAWDLADAGWFTRSGWPGWGGNVVVAGHSPARDPRIWSRSVFRQLAYLAPGDSLELTAGTDTFRYAVVRVLAIAERDAAQPASVAWIAQGTPERLTLITCWPPQSAAYRIIVIAQPIDVRPGGKS